MFTATTSSTPNGLKLESAFIAIRPTDCESLCLSLAGEIKQVEIKRVEIKPVKLHKRR